MCPPTFLKRIRNELVEDLIDIFACCELLPNVTPELPQKLDERRIGYRGAVQIGEMTIEICSVGIRTWERIGRRHAGLRLS